MTKRTCLIDECTNKVRARGWCGKHYERWRAHGNPLYTVIPAYEDNCTVLDCDDKQVAKGYCPSHYNKLKNHGDPNYEKPPRVVDPCMFEGCENPQKGRRLCSGHLQMSRRDERLTPLRRRRRVDESPIDYFWEQVDRTDECWIWTRTIDSSGYGTYTPGGVTVRAHRYAYEISVGLIPEGLLIDHICRVRACVNPGHLRLATHEQNHQNLPERSERNTSGYRGVSLDKRYGMWMGRATLNGKTYSTGHHSTPEEAGEAAERLRQKIFTHSTN